jgi:hypothetical protein
MQQEAPIEPSPHGDLTSEMDGWHARSCAAQRKLLSCIAEADRQCLWKQDGARDMAHWLWMRYGLSEWRARRWVAAAHALGSLPAIGAAFESGVLGVDKVVELCRFATPDTEASLVAWAERASAGAIRARADREIRSRLEESTRVEKARYLRWWQEDEGRSLRVEGLLPAAAGAVLVKAVERMAERLPRIRDGALDPAGARRADALVAIASTRIAGDPDPDRATMVVHVPVEMLAEGSGDSSEPGCGIEGGGVIHAETARRLACTARIETVIEDGSGRVVGLGRTSREPSPQMMRALRHRDHGCRFPGCGTKAFTNAHHVRWWSGGGGTDLDNLVLLCSHHHTLVHEHGWRIRLDENDTVSWFRPDGVRYRAGPQPVPA